MIAQYMFVFRVNSIIDASPKTRKACELLCLKHVNSGVIIPVSRKNQVKHLARVCTWGVICAQTHDRILKARAFGKNSRMPLRFAPPIGGFKCTKKLYSKRGALGDRGKHVKNLINRLLRAEK